MNEQNIPQKNILGKLHKIMSEIDYIQKDMFNSHGNYKYASEKVIKEIIHKKLVEHKVLFKIDTEKPYIEKIEHEQKINSILFLPCIYIFYDVESGESITGTFTASGQCRDDKGNYAALTGAIKYIMTSTFLIPTGDDAEKDEEKEYLEDSVASPNNPQIDFAKEDNQQGQINLNAKCFICKGAMWDNRFNKTNPKSPDLKCKNKQCIDPNTGFVTAVWLKK